MARQNLCGWNPFSLGRWDCCTVSNQLFSKFRKRHRMQPTFQRKVIFRSLIFWVTQAVRSKRTLSHSLRSQLRQSWKYTSFLESR